MSRVERISALKDPRVAEARELTSASGRSRLGKCLLEGTESISWALESGLTLEHVFMSSDHEHGPLYAQLQARQIPCYLVSDGILKKISDTSYLVPYLGVLSLPDRYPTEMGNFVVVLDRVQDHGNIGTIIRTARAFGIHDLVSTTPELDLYYKKIISASRGSVFGTHLQRFASGRDAVHFLQQRGYQVIATSPYARDIQAQAPLQARPVALIVGNETEGISDEIREMADLVVQIPMSGLVESLNVGVATGISLYELKFRMIITMLTSYIRASLGREIGVASLLTEQVFHYFLQQVSDLGSTQVVLLMKLQCDQRMALAQVASEVGVFGEECTALLEPLFNHTYIQKLGTDPEMIELTAEGERVLAQLWNVVERAENAILSDFSEEERGQFRRFISRIQENCQRILQ